MPQIWKHTHTPWWWFRKVPNRQKEFTFFLSFNLLEFVVIVWTNQITVNKLFICLQNISYLIAKLFFWTFCFQILIFFSNLQIGFRDSDHKSRQIALPENVSGKTECIFTKNSATSLSHTPYFCIFSFVWNSLTPGCKIYITSSHLNPIQVLFLVRLILTDLTVPAYDRLKNAF